MKKLLFFLVTIFLAVPVVADDLKPESSDRAIAKYRNFWKTEAIDVSNHVVWKLYVFRAVPPSANPQGSANYIIAGLTPYSKSSYYVGLRINQLYDFLSVMPQRGDVIVVSGRVLQHRTGPVALPQRARVLKYLTLDLDGVANLTQEHFDPTTPSTPVVDYGLSTSPAASPTPVTP